MAATTTKLSTFSSPSLKPNPNPKSNLFPHTLKPFSSSKPPKPLLSAAFDGARVPAAKPGTPGVCDGDEKPRQECGVVGIYDDPEAAQLCYLALHSLQHRGQEGAGIVLVTVDAVLHSVTGVGLISDVFSKAKLAQLPGSTGIGHVRYSTTGSSMLKNIAYEREVFPGEVVVVDERGVQSRQSSPQCCRI